LEKYAMATSPEITMAITLTDGQAFAFAEFLKRASFDHYRGLAANEDEAYAMRDAGEAFRKALIEHGYNPR
jgi:hypothetical protein